MGNVLGSIVNIFDYKGLNILLLVVAFVVIAGPFFIVDTVRESLGIINSKLSTKVTYTTVIVVMLVLGYLGCSGYFGDTSTRQMINGLPLKVI